MTRPRSGLFLDDVADELPLVEVEESARRAGGQRVVGDHHDRLLELAVELLEQVEDLLGAVAVEVAGRLVGDEQVRVGHDRPGDRHALLLAAGELPGIVVLASFQADDPQAVITFSRRWRFESLVSSSGSSTFSNAVRTGIRL